MYEAKYSQYITKSKARFATPEEIKNECKKISREKTDGCGTPLYYENGCLYVDSSDSHYFVKGPTGSKKSRVVGNNIINSIFSAGENAVINDPKGELFRRTGNYAKENGYNVLVLNLRDVTKSNGWNPLSLAYGFYFLDNMPEAEQAINDFASAVMAPAINTSNDRFWADMGGIVLTYCTECLMDSVPVECFNMSNIIQMTHEGNAPSFRKILDDMDPSSSTAVCMHSILDLQAERTSSCIYATLKQALIPFTQNKSLLELLCKNDIQFNELAEKKTVIYIIYPDEKKSLCSLITLFFTQCYQYLVAYSSRFNDSKLPIRVNFVLDEFCNLPPIENFENCISEARGHNIRYFLFGQSYGQLENKYKENAETIISNCEWVIFPSKEYKFLRTVSDLCGREYDYYGMEHDLVSVSEMQHLKKYTDCAEALILKSGQYPFITKLPDYEHIDIFKRCPEATFEEIKSDFNPVFISFREWVSGIGYIYNAPFPKKKRSVDLRYCKF